MRNSKLHPARGGRLVVLAAFGLGGAAVLLGPGVGEPAARGQTPESPVQARPAEPGTSSDPYEAYREGRYDAALERFMDVQVERPEDPELRLNIGSVHYQRKDYEAAKAAYARAADTADPTIRSEALYNLGNTAYREGKLNDAIDFYMGALEENPDDEDAKFNLEFVREEIKRRQEQQQEREQNQQNQQQNQDSEDQSSENQQDQQQSQSEEGAQNEGGDPQQGGDRDQDGDGVPDDVEQMGRNPTDPNNPDTDGDGKTDGEEDLNANGQVDPGETDPNQPDGEGPAQGQPQASEGQLTEAEAERYLQALEERQPDKTRRAKKAKIVRTEKDW